MSKKSSFLGLILSQTGVTVCNIYPVCYSYSANLSVELSLTLLKKEQEILRDYIKVDMPVQIEIPRQAEDDCLLTTVITENHNIPTELFTVELVCDSTRQICPRFVKQQSGVLLLGNQQLGDLLYIIHLDHSGELDIVEDDICRQIKLNSLVEKIPSTANRYVFIDCRDRYSYPVLFSKVRT